MTLTIWGARGSVPAPGPETQRYGGNTACVELRGDDGTLLILDAGTGIRRMGEAVCCEFRKIHILLTHLHLDHIQGLGFFEPLYDPNVEVHVYGPASTTQDLRSRLMRYLSPPLFPVHMRELPNLILHEIGSEPFQIGEFTIKSSLICHPGPTLGFRIESPAGVLTYMPDHEPVIGGLNGHDEGDWLSGYELSKGADILIHDGQFTPELYRQRMGWGHCSLVDAIKFARLAKVGKLVTFHYDPNDDDAEVDRMIASAIDQVKPDFEVIAGFEGLHLTLQPQTSRIAV